MPISPDRMKLYPGGIFGTSAGELFGVDTHDQIEALRRSTGFDALGNPAFWQSWIVTQLGAKATAHKDPVDLIVETPRHTRTAEVKFSNSFLCAFRFRNSGLGPRRVFKWLMTIPQARRRLADAVIFIGVDELRLVYSWVVPRAALPPGRSITLTAPSDRRREIGGLFDQFFVPATEILPGFLRACHNTYDAAFRRGNAAVTRRRKSSQRDMLDEVGK